MYTVNIWSGNSHSREVDIAAWDKWNETIGKEMGVHVNFTVHGGDSITKNMELAIQSGTAPDFIFGDLVKLAEAGNIVAYDDIPGGDEIIKKYEGKLANLKHQYKGKTYCLPGGPASQGLIYNKDMFKAAGIVDENGEAKPPRTWSELVECAEKLTDKAKGEYGIIAPLKWTGWFGSDITSPSQTLIGFEGFNPATGKYDYSGYKIPMESWVKMFNANSVYPSAESLDNDSARAMFAEGKIGMKFGFSFDVGVLNDQFPAKCDWGVAPYPMKEDGTGYKQRIDYGTTSYINAASKVPYDILLQVQMSSNRESAINAYKNCTGLPGDWSIIDEVELENPKKGWEEFANLVKISSLTVLKPSMELAGLENMETIFTKYVLTGQMSVDDAIKLGTENANKGVETYFASNPNQSLNDYIIPGWKPELQ